MIFVSFHHFLNRHVQQQQHTPPHKLTVVITDPAVAGFIKAQLAISYRQSKDTLSLKHAPLRRSLEGVNKSTFTQTYRTKLSSATSLDSDKPRFYQHGRFDLSIHDICKVIITY
jgi:hypothetical protein